MTSLKGDLRSIMGTPFGGVGHAVLIFSRVTRAAFNSDSVVLQLHDRIEMPEEANGKFQVDGLDPGPIRIELEGGTVHNHGWNIDLPDEGVWSLTDLVDAQVDWSPAVIGRAEAAAREARDHADRAEAGADRVGTAEQVGAWASEASSSASDAASARIAAVIARDASRSARDVAEGHADRAATSESNAATSETNAKQSEDNAGDYAAVATTAAAEAVDAMERATDLAGGDFATHEYVDDSIVQFEDSFSAKVVKALQVRRIITSANPDEHLSEGDLLLVTEPLKRLYRRLDSMDGITQRWNVNRWDIATDSPSGDSVSLHTGGAQARRLASVDAVSGLADVEVVAKIKASAFTPASGSSPSLVLRGSGEAGNETAYSASVGRNTIRMGKFVNGAYTALDSITETIPVDEWFWLRFRAFGPKLQVKIWPDGTPEPAEWRRTTYDSSIEAGGWIGASATTNTADLYYHSIGVAALTSGDEQAPTEAV